jgi:photosystem II stability/assembly factor-like uncharacterized protein
MKKFVLLFSIMMLIYCNAYSEFKWEPASIFYGFKGTLITDSNNLYVFSDSIFYSSDKGISWTYHSFPNLEFNINSIACKGDTLFGATSKGLYFSVDKGKSWQERNSDSIKNQAFYEIAVKDNNIYLFYYKTIYISTNNGSTWAKYIVNTYDTYSINLLVDDDGIFILNSKGLCKSANNGIDWVVLNLSLVGLIKKII